MASTIEDYLKLRDEVDRRAAELVELHGTNIVCRAGCNSCCVNLTVLAVEFEAIRQQLAATGEPIIFDENSTCGFLDEKGNCRIYSQRPLICRTHGLPIAFADEDDGHNVSFCELNFSRAKASELDFGPENTLELEEMNEKLARMNLDFLNRARKSGDPVRIELSRLVP